MADKVENVAYIGDLFAAIKNYSQTLTDSSNYGKGQGKSTEVLVEFGKLASGSMVKTFSDGSVPDAISDKDFNNFVTLPMPKGRGF